MEYSGYESEGKGKRKQHCTYCKNHGKQARKTNHKCDYENCECLLCKLTRLSRLIMRHQQRLWRHLKDSKRREDAADGAAAAAAAAAAATSDSAVAANGGGSTKQQKCDMCRNHGEITSKRAHKNACPYQNCTCALCNLTRKRRDIMRHQQRVRRSQVTSKQHNEAWEYVIQATAELEFLNFKSTPPTNIVDDNHPSSSSASTSPSPISTSGPMSLKSEAISSTSSPPIPIATNKSLASVPTEMPPLEPLEDSSPVRYSPGPMIPPASNACSRPIEPLTPPEPPIQSSIGVKDIPVMDNEPSWRNLKREREEVLKWSPKVQRENDLFWNLDFMRGHQALTGRLEPQVPMEGINFYDSVSGMDFGSNHGSPFKSLAPMMDSSRIPSMPLKKTRTDENMHFQYNPMFWGNTPVEPRVGFVPDDLQHQCYRRVIMNTSPDLRMRTPPGLIPIPQPQPPLRPRPLAPLRPHALPTSMDWDHVNLRYLAYFLNRGPPYSDTMPTAGPFGLPREASFLHPSVP